MAKTKKKRANNEGSLYQRANGTWRAQVTINGRRLSYTAKSQKEGLRWNREMLNQIDAGLTFENSKMRIEDFMKNWLKSIESNVRPGTVVQYTQVTRDYILPELANMELGKLTSQRIQELYVMHKFNGVGDRSVRTTHAVLHRALNYAKSIGALYQNPASSIKAPRYRAKEMMFFDQDQVKKFLSFAKENKDRYYALYKLAVTTGMRQGELLGLKWIDFDEPRSTLLVNRQLKRKKGAGFVFAPPKTKAGVRSIVLGDDSKNSLRSQKELLYRDKLIAGSRWKENGLIFPSTIGTPTIPSKLIIRFKQLIKDAGLPVIRFHDLRHTAATLMLNNGVPIIVVSKRLGHSQPSITLDVYGHLITSMQNESAELMDRITDFHKNGK
jgi:integrase